MTKNKPTDTFKLSKKTKTAMSLTKFKSAEDRNAFRRSMIDAEIEASKKGKTEKSKD